MKSNSSESNRHGHRARFKSLAAVPLTAFLLFQSAACLTGAPAKLAIVPMDKACEPPADLLTARLSKSPELVLLERAEIVRVLDEQTRAGMSGEDYLKVGQLLGADGLLILETADRGGTKVMGSRLVAVAPAVVLAEEAVPLPLADPAAWSQQAAGRLKPFVPKLTVLAKDAIPISVLNLRAPVRTTESRELEVTLTQMLIHRLTREPEVFVLERRYMRDVVFEEELKASDPSAFWTGRYLLDGTLDSRGVDQNRMTITARLTSPQGGPAIVIEAAGPRTNLAQMIESLTTQVLASLKRKPAWSNWHPQDEAKQYLEEATWAYRWKAMREAQEASESAWALGCQTREVARLRLRSYLDDAWGVDQYYSRIRWPEPSKFNLAERAAELFLQNAELLFSDTSPTNNTAAFTLGVELLGNVSGFLRSYYEAAEMRQGLELRLAHLRAQARTILALLEAPRGTGTGLAAGRAADDRGLGPLKWGSGGLWFDQPEQALPLHRATIQAGLRPEDLPCLVGWTWKDRKRVPGLLKAFVNEVVNSTNTAVRREGMYLAVVQAPFDEAGTLRDRENELLAVLWQDRQEMLSNRAGILARLERVLQKKYGISLDRFPHRDEPLAVFYQRLRKEYLTTVPVLESGSESSAFSDSAAFGNSFGLLFLQDPFFTRRNFLPQEAQELLPLLEAFKRRAQIRPAYQSSIVEVENWLKVTAKQGGGKPVFWVPPEARAPVPAEETPAARRITIEFRSWQPAQPDLGPGLDAEVLSHIVREDRVWFQVSYRKGITHWSTSRTAYVGVEHQTGAALSVLYPAEFGLPDPIPPSLVNAIPYFEVTGDSLVVSAKDCIRSYGFRDKAWRTIPAPMERSARVVGHGGHYYLNTTESLLDVDPASGKVTILASTRRRPALNPLDEAGGFRDLRPGAQGQLEVKCSRGAFVLNSKSQEWQAFQAPAPASPAEEQRPGGDSLVFEKDGRVVVTRATAGSVRDATLTLVFLKEGKPVDVENPAPERYPRGCPPVCIKIPAGFIVVSRLLNGCWLVPKTDLDRWFGEAQAKGDR